MYTLPEQTIGAIDGCPAQIVVDTDGTALYATVVWNGFRVLVEPDGIGLVLVGDNGDEVSFVFGGDDLLDVATFGRFAEVIGARVIERLIVLAQPHGMAPTLRRTHAEAVTEAQRLRQQEVTATLRSVKEAQERGAREALAQLQAALQLDRRAS